MTNLKLSESYTDGFSNYLVFTYLDGSQKSFLVQDDELIPHPLPSSAVLCSSFSLLN
jgi:hypothetical protein